MNCAENQRCARTWISTFHPVSCDEIIALQRNMGSVENGYWRQVLTYWEMAAAFVLHGVLDPDLFLDCNGEFIFIYAKFTPFFEEYEKIIGQPFMRQTGKMIETHPAMKDRYNYMLGMMEARRKREASA